MKIANSSRLESWQLRSPTHTARTRVASLIAVGSVLLTPWLAAAQGEAAPPPASEGTAGPEAPPASEAAPPGQTASNDAADDGAPAGAELGKQPGADDDAGAGAEAVAAVEGERVEEAPEEFERDSIVVAGYRKSLKSALWKKRKSTGQVDAIVAEDMAEFPDLNLAESLQRMPGVAIERTDGEGARITVRGLGPRYTRTRVNGMDARAAVRGNATRSFDFNMFAAELFNSVVVHKTATAVLGEGALGEVVDLNTARAFDYEKGFTFLVGAQGGCNDLSNTLVPRATGLVGYHDPKGIWGATASVAYSKTRIDTASASATKSSRRLQAALRASGGDERPSVHGALCLRSAWHAFRALPDPATVDLTHPVRAAG